VIERSERGVESCVVIEDCSRAVDVGRRAEFLGNEGQIDVFSIKMTIAIMKQVHVMAALAGTGG